MLPRSALGKTDVALSNHLMWSVIAPPGQQVAGTVHPSHCPSERKELIEREDHRTWEPEWGGRVGGGFGELVPRRLRMTNFRL